MKKKKIIKVGQYKAKLKSLKKVEGVKTQMRLLVWTFVIVEGKYLNRVVKGISSLSISAGTKNILWLDNLGVKMSLEKAIDINEALGKKCFIMVDDRGMVSHILRRYC